MKKLTALLLAIVMICAMVLSGCSGKEEPAKSNESAPDAANQVSDESASEEPVKLTVWTMDSTRIEDHNTNDMTLWLEEQGNFDLEITLIPTEDFNTKVNMALTVGAVEDLPDVIIGANFPAASVQEWAEAGTILPLTQYYADPALAVNINEAIERTGIDYTSQLVMPDGEIYTVASLNQSYGNEYRAKTWLYRPWLEALDAEIPTTTEEFYELLKLVSQTDLNGNGKKDEVGLLGATQSTNYHFWFEYLMNAFVYAGDNQYRTVNDGVVSAAYTTEEWKEGLQYIKKMFDEGLIMTETLTMADEQYAAQLNTEDHTVFALTYYGSNLFDNSETAADYVCINPLVGPENVQYATYTPSAATSCFVVTANCENPDVAFTLGDLMSSEVIGISQRWGAQGKDWDYAADVEGAQEKYVPSVAGFDLSIITYDDGNFWGGTAVGNSSWRQTGPFVRHYALANGWGVESANADPYKIIFNEGCAAYQNGGWAPEEVISTLIYTIDEADLIAEIESNLQSYVKEYWAAVMVGAKNLDGDWDQYLEELEKIGLNEYLDVVQTVYDRMYK